jgi:hypothetical protein
LEDDPWEDNHREGLLEDFQLVDNHTEDIVAEEVPSFEPSNENRE